ncbi:ABC transporter ATP-binding protein [Pseudoflavonifractor sp. An85]|uniref:ABC transporter ATP-binding protein n=1 Tax=Pseudoflavonifractor sp. An85 TaxID=1965661 RepID=UPI000B37FAD4|nr:ABC transporter ATP-binding protein [Pseudoflavonifractor sp. An85]OUN25706.1 teichoic acid ABC transporter ATP-binding protein [Pseudoflavonifractor sp. An85]
MSILEVNNVSIRYMTGDFKDIGIKEYITRRLRGKYEVKKFWADKNVTFTLEKGDMLGIIGTNGAGKSTLLKAISGIMEPTEGYVKREGTIAALLELASGFDGDLTVRENTYLRGAMLGYTRKFMNEMYDQIIAFADLKEFEDRPFKQLSSGMKSRLAFSIACLVQPDILILDEVLSVGDGAFRKKSEEKMKEIIYGGATSILVSHSLDQVREMCTKILWLHKGHQIEFGDDVQGICDRYQEMLDGKRKIEVPAD